MRIVMRLQVNWHFETLTANVFCTKILQTYQYITNMLKRPSKELETGSKVNFGVRKSTSMRSNIYSSSTTGITIIIAQH